MSIPVTCSACGSASDFDDKLRGREIPCPSCTKPLRIEAPAGEDVLEAAEEFVAATPPPRKAVPPRARGGPVPETDEAAPSAKRPRKAGSRASSLPMVLMFFLGSLVVVVGVGIVIALLVNAWLSASKVQDKPEGVTSAPPGEFLPPFNGQNGGGNQQPDPIQPGGDKAADAGKVEPAGRATTDIGRKIYSRLLKSTVLIIHNQRVGNHLGVTVGSGTLIDKANRLIVTNYHVAGKSGDLYVFFPIFRNGKLVADFQYFTRQVDDQRNLLHGKSVYPASGKDLALVQVDRLPPDALALPIAKERPSQADPVFSVGHPGAEGNIVGLWMYTEGSIRQLRHMRWPVGKPPEEIFSIDADILLTNSQTNHGDSGGPLVNNHGELVAVTQGAFTEANALSIFIDATEVKTLLRRYADEYGVKLDLPSGPAVQGDTAGIPELILGLRDPDVKKRQAAASRLGEFGPDAKMAVPDLIGALKDKDEFVRRFADSSLQKIGAPTRTEVPALVRLLDDANPELRLRTLDFLTAVGPDAEAALPAVLKAVKDTDPRIRAGAARALGRAGAGAHDKVLGPLTDATKDKEKPVRVAAAEALAGDLPLNPGDVPLLVELLGKPDVEVRVEAARAARKLGPEARETKASLLAALKDPNADLRRAAMEALVEVGLEKDSLPALDAALKDKDFVVRRHAMNAAVKLGPDARPLAGLVADAFKEWRLRKDSLEALAKLGPAARDEHVMQVLNEALADNQYQVPAAAAVAAIHPTGKEGKIVVPRLLALLELEPDPAHKEIRARAEEALGKTGPNALPSLEKLLGDARPHVRAAAATALGEMGAAARSSVPKLTLLQAGDESAEVRIAAGEAVRRIAP